MKRIEITVKNQKCHIIGKKNLKLLENRKHFSSLKLKIEKTYINPIYYF